MRAIAYVFLIAALVFYALAILAKFGVGVIDTKPISVAAFAGITAVFAAVFAILGLEKK
ncbi:MAG: hypothetical protein AB1742_13000 [bacterium]